MTGLPLLLRRYLLWMIVLALLSAGAQLVSTHFARPTQWVHGHDLMVFAPRFKLFGTAEFWSSPGYPFTYPAPLALVFAAIYRLGHALRDYTLACAAAALAWACWLAAGLYRRGVSPAMACAFAAVAVATSWPIYFQIDSANIEAVVAVVLALGVLALWSGRWWVGAVLIGIAGSMKIFPLLLLVLLLSRGKYRQFAVGLAVAIAVTIGSLAVAGPTVLEAQRGVDAGLLFLRAGNLMPGTPMVATHSLWALLKWTRVAIDQHFHSVDAAHESHILAAMLTVYMAGAAILGVALYVGWMRRLPLLNQLLGLTVCAVLLPPVSMDYTLLHLLVPFGLLCLRVAERPRQESIAGSLTVAFLCFAMIFSAGSFLRFHTDFDSQIRTLALLVLLVTVNLPGLARLLPDHPENYPFHASYPDESDTPAVV